LKLAAKLLPWSLLHNQADDLHFQSQTAVADPSEFLPNMLLN